MPKKTNKQILIIKLHGPDEINCKNCILCEKCHDKFSLPKNAICPKFSPNKEYEQSKQNSSK